MFGVRFWGLSTLLALGAAALIGVPTVLIPTSLFHRMTPTSPLDYVIWSASSSLIGVLMALAILYPTPAKKRGMDPLGTGRALGGTLLSFFSVGCPVCNQLVVFLLGISGAMTFFNPLRPWLGVVALALLGVTLFLRVRVLRAGCPTQFRGIIAGGE